MIEGNGSGFGGIARSLSNWSCPWFIIAFVMVHLLVGVNIVVLSTDMISGDGSAKNMESTTRLDFLRIPDEPWTRKYQAHSRLAADFAQIYFPSRNLSSLADAYDEVRILGDHEVAKRSDPFGRPSRYTPLLHVICAYSVCSLDYGYASITHMALQTVLFLLALAYAFRYLQLSRYVLHGILLVNVCLFLTPAGLFWFERGQLSLYVSLSYLFLMLGLMKRSWFCVLLAALFAYMKLTALPFAFVFWMVSLTGSRDRYELTQRFLLGCVYVSALVVLFLLYLEPGIRFLSGVLRQEYFSSPSDLSLANLIPRYATKIVPFGLVVVGYLHIRTQGKDPIAWIPFLVGSAILLITYPTLTYDYNLPVVLCFVPFILAWYRYAMQTDAPSARFLSGLYLCFVLFMSFSNHIRAWVGENTAPTWIYVGVALIFLVWPLLRPATRQHRVVDT